VLLEKIATVVAATGKRQVC